MATVADLSGNGTHQTDTHIPSKLLKVPDATPIPGTVAGIGQIFIDEADGDLKIKYGDGTVKLIVADT